MRIRLTTRLAALAVATVLGLLAAVNLTAAPGDTDPVRPAPIAEAPAGHHGAHHSPEG